MFPKENIGTYFVPPIKKSLSLKGKPVFAKGKLVDKVRNILYQSGERRRQKRTLPNDYSNNEKELPVSKRPKVDGKFVMLY